MKSLPFVRGGDLMHESALCLSRDEDGDVSGGLWCLCLTSGTPLHSSFTSVLMVASVFSGSPQGGFLPVRLLLVRLRLVLTGPLIIFPPAPLKLAININLPSHGLSGLLA